jgi:hypothetical protein
MVCTQEFFGLDTEVEACLILKKKWDFQIHVLVLVLIKEMGFLDTCTGISVDQRNGISRYMYWY